MLTLAALAVLAPFMMWAERAQRFRALSPIEQNLQRASHGAALVVLTLLIGYGAYGVGGGLGLIAWVIHDPASAWLPAALVAGLLLYGGARFLAGVRRGAGMRDGLLAARAVLKLAAGAALTFLPISHGATVAGLISFPDQAWWITPVWLIGVWCLVTGAVRLAMLTLGGGGGGRRSVEKHIEGRKIVWRSARK